MSESSIRERVTNVLCMLYLIDHTNKFGAIENRLKLQKMVFLAQKQSVEKKLKSFGYNFFRWHKGPFSKNLSIDLDTMQDVGFISIRHDKIELTSKGREFLKDSSGLLELNENFLIVIDSIIRKYGKIPPDELKEKVYDMQVAVPQIHQLMAIRDIPPGKLILFKTADKNAKCIFGMSSSWLATLELSFSKEAMESLENAVDDAAEGRLFEANIRDNST